MAHNDHPQRFEASTTRRRFVKQVAAAGAALSGASLAPSLASRVAAQRQERPPNVVLFLSDDHGARDAGCYGNDVIRTPSIDRLAEEGMRFDRAFAVTATCVPARASLYTGLGPHRHGAHVNHGFVRPGLTTLPEHLARQGYRTLLAGKVHVEPKRAFPFEYLDTEGDWTATIVSEESGVAQFLRSEEAHAQPFCLVIATNDPHVPWPTEAAYDPADVSLHPFHLDTPETRQATANYYTDVERMDRELGKTLDLLDEQGLAENTAVMYTSDQGPQLPHAKWELYDYGLRVPFVVRWPERVAAGSTSQAMLSSVDVLPTIVEVAGGAAPDGVDGRSVLGVLRQETDRHRDAIFAAHTRDGMMNYFPIRAVRTGRYKYLWNLAPERAFTNHITNSNQFKGRGGAGLFDSWMERANREEAARERLRFYQQRPEEELYDLRRDPHELINRAEDPALQSVKNELRGKLEQWMEQQGDKGRSSWSTRAESRAAWDEN